jgi:23S rRNA (guanosine2251-2'-O)-methyltransferase
MKNNQFSPFIQQISLRIFAIMRKLKTTELGRMSVTEFKSAEKWPICLVLDNIRSMNNVGSMFRTSDAFLVKTMFLCGITACPPHRDITKTAIGAENSVNWEYHKNTLDVIQQLKNEGYFIYAIEQAIGSVSLKDIEYPNQPIAFVMGNEIDGVQQEVIDSCHACLEIPQLGTKHSFNVAVTCGMILWDYAKAKQL